MPVQSKFLDCLCLILFSYMYTAAVDSSKREAKINRQRGVLQ